jgi:hypothetical protein
MSKSFRRHKKLFKLKSLKLKEKKFKGEKLKRQKLIEGNGEKIKCSICEKMVNLKDTFIPYECLMKYGKSAHRICEDCWWDPKTGFALESSSHKCPGCQKGLPLNHVNKNELQIVVDLTED